MGSGRKIQLGMATRKMKVFRWELRLNTGASSRPATQATTISSPHSNGANHAARSAAESTVRSICVNTSAGNATSTTSRLKRAVNSAARNPRRRASQPATITRNIAVILTKTTCATGESWKISGILSNRH
jgi:hypothetical protein